MHHIRRIGLMAILVGALAAGVIACGGSGSGGGGTNAASADGSSGGGTPTVTVGLAVPTSTYAPLYLGVDQGLFKKAGVNVKIVTFKGGSDLVKGVVSGSVDMGVTGLAGLLPAIQQGQPLKVFYGGFNAPIYQWWAKPPTNSIASGKDKRWGITQIGTTMDFLTRYLLRQHGMTAQDVKIVQGGPSAGRLAAMKAGQIDVNAFSIPETIEAQQAGYNVIAKQSDFVKEWPLHVAFAKSDFLQGNQDVVQKFLRGLVKGFEMTRNDPKATEQALIKNVKIPPDLADGTYKAFAKYEFPDGHLPDAEAMDVFWKVGIQNGEFQQPVPESKWLNSKWIDSYPQWAN